MTLCLPAVRTTQPNWLRDPLWTRARMVPSLDLDLAGTGSLRDRVSGQNLVTFTRASDATYVDAQGIIRTAPTNLLLRSEDFSTTWTTNGTCSVSTDQTVAPNGTLTADEITVNNGLVNYVGQSVSVTSGTAYTLSVYVKAGTITTISFRAAIAGSDGYIVYAFATNSISIATPTLISSASSVSLGNGWYRLSMQYTPTVSGAASIRIGGGNTNNGTCYIWGAQLEEGSTATEYLPTSATINGAPRITHDSNGKCLGLLVEESRTNLLRWSEVFDSGAWGRPGLLAFGSGSIANAIAAPDGTVSADLLTENTNTSSHAPSQTNTITAGSTIVASVYVKPASGTRHLRIQVNSDTGANGFRAYFDLSQFSVAAQTTGFGTGSAISNSANISSVGDGWYRISCAGTVDAAATDATVSFFLQDTTTGSSNYTGDGTSGLYLWGAQLEVGEFPTSYLKTQAAQSTRAADIATITGTNFSGWYRQDEGTVFSQSNVIAPDVQTQTVWSLTGGTYPTSLRQPQSTGDKFRAQIGGTFTPIPGTGAALSSGTTKACVAYSGTAGRLQVGSSSNDVTASGVLDPTQFNVGSLGGISTILNGTISRLTFWPRRLPDPTLQELTR